jgi:DNA-binding transcriptional regulator YhcF (GntR family)
MILEGVHQNGDAMLLVQQIASDQKISPITVFKAYQVLVDEDLVEKKIGLGMFQVRAHQNNYRKTSGGFLSIPDCLNSRIVRNGWV